MYKASANTASNTGLMWFVWGIALLLGYELTNGSTIFMSQQFVFILLMALIGGILLAREIRIVYRNFNFSYIIWPAVAIITAFLAKLLAMHLG